jgi:hypothetical protein
MVFAEPRKSKFFIKNTHFATPPHPAAQGGQTTPPTQATPL